jgi:PAS domain S-box-containing protein
VEANTLDTVQLYRLIRLIRYAFSNICHTGAKWAVLRNKPLLDLSSLSEQERNQLLVNAISDYAIYMLDASGTIASWNPGAERFKGYSANEVIGRHFQMFFPDEDRAADVPGRTLRVAARDGRYESEGWRVRKDGSRFWAHAVVDAIRSPQGELLGFAKVVRDITEKKAAKTDLRASEERFRLLVQGVKDCAIYLLDKEGFVTNWNLGAEHIKGYSSSEIVGEHFSRFYTEPDRAAGEPARALSTALIEGKYEREAWRVRKDGSLFWAHVLIDPIYDDEGNHIGFAKVTRDRTEQKKAAEQVEEAQRNLLQSQKLQAIGELTGGIAHDFNNMLTVIAGSADFLRRNRAMPEEKKLRYLDGIIEITERATTLTNQLLSFARRQPLKPQVLEIRKRLESARELLSRTLGSRITVMVEANGPNLMVEVDPGQLEASILNAAVNAGRSRWPRGLKRSVGKNLCGCPSRTPGSACPSALENARSTRFSQLRMSAKARGLAFLRFTASLHRRADTPKSSLQKVRGPKCHYFCRCPRRSQVRTFNLFTRCPIRLRLASCWLRTMIRFELSPMRFSTIWVAPFCLRAMRLRQ